MTPSLPTRLTSMDVPSSACERMETMAVSRKYAHCMVLPGSYRT